MKKQYVIGLLLVLSLTGTAAPRDPVTLATELSHSERDILCTGITYLNARQPPLQVIRDGLDALMREIPHVSKLSFTPKKEINKHFADLAAKDHIPLLRTLLLLRSLPAGSQLRDSGGDLHKVAHTTVSMLIQDGLESLSQQMTPTLRQRLLRHSDLLVDPLGFTNHWREGVDELIDAIAGLDFKTSEAAIEARQNLASHLGEADWSFHKLDSQALLTSYFDLDSAFNYLDLPKGSRVVDLGTAYGRPGILLGAKYPGIHFTGYEINPIRAAEGQRILTELKYTKSTVQEQDLSDPAFRPAAADVYFMYDPVNGFTRRKLLNQLQEIADERGKPIRIIAREGRGDFLQFLDKERWLKRTAEIPSKTGPLTNMVVYESLSRAEVAALPAVPRPARNVKDRLALVRSLLSVEPAQQKEILLAMKPADQVDALRDISWAERHPFSVRKWVQAGNARRLFQETVRDSLSLERRLELLKQRALLKEPDTLFWRNKWRRDLDETIDALFGMRFAQNEASAPEAEIPTALGTALWSTAKLPATYLMTSYFDLDRILKATDPRRGSSFVDLGSAYGRVGAFLGLKRPDLQFTGYEINGVRKAEAERVALSLHFTNTKYEQVDLSDATFKPKVADYYFLFNPVNKETLAKLLGQLREIAAKRKPHLPIRIIAREGNGDFLKQFEAEKQWLKRTGEIPSGVFHNLPTRVYESFHGDEDGP